MFGIVIPFTSMGSFFYYFRQFVGHIIKECVPLHR